MKVRVWRKTPPPQLDGDALLRVALGGRPVPPPAAPEPTGPLARLVARIRGTLVRRHIRRHLAPAAALAAGVVVGVAVGVALVAILARTLREE